MFQALFWWVWWTLLIWSNIKIVKEFSCFIFNMYHISSFSLTYFINISVAEYFTPYFVILDICTIVANAVTNDNHTTHHLHWFWNVSTDVMGDLGRYSSDDMGSTCNTEDTKCSIITIKPIFYMVINSSPTYPHYPINNLILCVHPDI